MYIVTCFDFKFDILKVCNFCYILIIILVWSIVYRTNCIYIIFIINWIRNNFFDNFFDFWFIFCLPWTIMFMSSTIFLIRTSFNTKFNPWLHSFFNLARTWTIFDIINIFPSTIIMVVITIFFIRTTIITVFFVSFHSFFYLTITFIWRFFNFFR